MTYMVIAWRDRTDEKEEGTRFQTEDWQLAGARVAHLLKNGYGMVVVDRLIADQLRP